MTTKNDTEQERAAFEAWITAPPYEKPVDLNPDSSAFPGQYRAYEVQLAWEAYQAGRAALQSQDQVDAERYRCLSSMATQQADALGPIFRIDVRRTPQTLFNFDAAVDHARRIEENKS